MNQAILEVKVWIPTCPRQMFPLLVTKSYSHSIVDIGESTLTSTHSLCFHDHLPDADISCQDLVAAACIANGVGLACHWYRAKTQGKC